MKIPLHQRLITYFCYVIGGIYIGIILLGDFLDAISNALFFVTTTITYIGSAIIVVIFFTTYIYLKKRPLPWVRNGQNIRITRIGFKTSSIAIGIIGLLWIPYFHDLAPKQQINRTETQGYLTPANDQIPVIPCSDPIPEDAMLIFLGNSLAYSTNATHKIITLNKEDVLAVSDSENGISVNAILRDKSGKGIVKIENNEFVINQNNFWYQKKPDRHTLEVYDQFNQRVFYIRYLNWYAIKILGSFYSDDTSIPPVIIGEDKQTFASLPMSGTCIGDLSMMSFTFTIQLDTIPNNKNASTK